MHSRRTEGVTAVLLLIGFAVTLYAANAFALTTSGLEKDFSKAQELSIGQRMAFWAEKFIGTPYDKDPMGAYVSERKLVVDDRVDCMYLTFRSAELARSENLQEAKTLALNMRFKTEGRLDSEGLVENYDERYDYAIDMITSGKWGRDITEELGPVGLLAGERGVKRVSALTRHTLTVLLKEKPGLFQSGDMVYFVKYPHKRVVGEVIGHLGILKVEDKSVWLIHASGTKKKGGEVKKVLFDEYLKGSNFIGAKILRFED